MEKHSNVTLKYSAICSRILGSPVLYLPLLDKNQMKGFYLGRENWVLDCLFVCD